MVNINPLNIKPVLKKGEFGIHYTGKAKEGNLTIVETDGLKGTRIEPVFSNPLRKGQYVKLVDDYTFERADLATDEIIGIVQSKPEYPDGYVPTEDAVDGSYVKRDVVIELFGGNIKTVNAKEANPEIEPGDSVKYDGNQRFTKGDNDDTRALNGVLANTGDEIDVLFGFIKLE
jgi:hypothetical protein